jgi:Zn-dependent peptidase ImmA (M78 family)
MEDEANTFAGALLMPAGDIRAHFVGRRVDFVLLASLKPEWKVAMQSLLMRARSLGFVSSNQERYLWQQFSARRMRMREPPELDFPIEKPSTVGAMLKLHIEALGYEMKDLELLLHMRSSEISSFYDFDGKAPKGPNLRVVR